MTLFTRNLALIAKSALDQTKIADYTETYLSWLCLCTLHTANAEQSFSAVRVENLHVLLSELSMYVNLFYSISLEIMRDGSAGELFILLSASLLAYVP